MRQSVNLRRGAMAVFFAVAMPIFLLMAALAVNVAYMELVRVQLRTSTDLAARAGARKLGLTGDQAQAIAAVQATALRNRVAGTGLSVSAANIQLGRSSRTASGAYTFTTGVPNPNAVSVTGIRNAANGGRVGLFFSNVIFEPTQAAVAAQIDRDVAIVLDRSGSMVQNYESSGIPTGWVAPAPAPMDTRWRYLDAAANQFLTRLESSPMDERVSFVTYSTTGTINNDLTSNYAQIRSDISAITNAYPGGWTAIGDAVELGRQTLITRGYQRAWATPAMVLMTDGIHNSGTLTPAQAADLCAADGIVIYAITYGADADTTAMQDVAARTGGRHWHAPNGAALNDAFKEIADSLPTMLVK